MKLNGNTEIEVCEGIIHLKMKKCMPIVISSEDKFRKGILYQLCDGCGRFDERGMYVDEKNYCFKCEKKLMSALKITSIKSKKRNHLSNGDE